MVRYCMAQHYAQAYSLRRTYHYRVPTAQATSPLGEVFFENCYLLILLRKDDAKLLGLSGKGWKQILT